MSLLASFEDRSRLSIDGSGVSKNDPNGREMMVIIVRNGNCLLKLILLRSQIYLLRL
jgi:hypothetical protein